MNEEIKRDKTLVVPLTESEMYLAKIEADKLGMPVTSFIRLLIKNYADGVTFEKKG